MTLIFKYTIPILIVGCILASLFIHKTRNEREQCEILAAIPIICWLLFGLLNLALRLREFILDEKGLTLTSSDSEMIKFDQINFLRQPVLLNPTYIEVNYTEPLKQKRRTIYLIPKGALLRNNNFLDTEEEQMTVFLRRMVRTLNAEYRKEDEPSRWMPFAILSATGFLAFMLAIQLLNNCG